MYCQNMTTVLVKIITKLECVKSWNVYLLVVSSSNTTANIRHHIGSVKTWIPVDKGVIESPIDSGHLASPARVGWSRMVNRVKENKLELRH